MNFACLKNKGSKTLLFSAMCIALGVMAFVIFILATSCEDKFDYAAQGESLVFSILALIVGIEALMLEEPKIPCLSTAWIYILVVLLFRFHGSFCGFDLLVSPVISWGSIVLLVIISGVLISCLRKNRQKVQLG